MWCKLVSHTLSAGQRSGDSSSNGGITVIESLKRTNHLIPHFLSLRELRFFFQFDRVFNFHCIVSVTGATPTHIIPGRTDSFRNFPLSNKNNVWTRKTFFYDLIFLFLQRNTSYKLNRMVPMLTFLWMESEVCFFHNFYMLISGMITIFT